MFYGTNVWQNTRLQLSIIWNIMLSWPKMNNHLQPQPKLCKQVVNSIEWVCFFTKWQHFYHMKSHVFCSVTSFWVHCSQRSSFCEWKPFHLPKKGGGERERLFLSISLFLCSFLCLSHSQICFWGLLHTQKQISGGHVEWLKMAKLVKITLSPCANKLSSVWKILWYKPSVYEGLH